MPLFKPKLGKTRPQADKEGEPPRPPFPSISTFLGLAAVMIVIWLLAYGTHFSASERPAPANITDTGAPK